MSAKKLIEKNIREAAQIVSLTGIEYFRIIDKISDEGLKGGIVYDAIIAECARKSKAEEIITVSHERLSPPHSR